MIKRFLCLLICIVLFVSYNTIPAYALGDPVMDEIEITSISNGDSRGGFPFVEGETGVLTYYIEYTTNGVPGYKIAIINYECQYINVPNTTNKVEAKLILNDFSDDFADILDADMRNYFLDVELLRSASKYYNCHSYAWYSQSADNVYWINDPKRFYRYNSYYDEVEDPGIGDIICYYSADGELLHSGIVNAVNNQSSNGECGDSNTVEVISKWGMSGLYKHNGYVCPYTSYGGGAAVTVKYYRAHRFHNYTYSQNLSNPSVHIATCSTCGYSTTENHTYKTLPGGGSRCTKCGYTSSGQIIMSDTPKPVEQ